MNVGTAEEYGIVTGTRTVRFERVLPGPIERVWAYLTESDKRARWLASGDSDLRVGGGVELVFRHADLTPHDEQPPEKYRQLQDGARFTGRITAYDPPRLLSHTWAEEMGESEVTYELTQRDDGSVLLVLTHRRLPDRGALVSVGAGWHTHLDILVDRLNGREPAPFWSTHGSLEAQYEQRIEA